MAQAVAAGAAKIEAAVVVTEGSVVDAAGLAAVHDLSPAAPLYVADPSGALLGSA